MEPHESHAGDERRISLLCLDGGGVRGLSSLRILQRIMECVNPSSPPKPCDYFDMICGTSTGGLIAIMLGRLKMSVSECIAEYQKLSVSVFTKCRHRVNWKGKIQGRFDHEALEEGVKDLLRRMELPEDELLKEMDGNPRCKTFVCTMSQQTSDIVVFPSYYSKTWGLPMLDRVRIWEAARATSAATSFFEPLVIDGKVFADGATGANNPIYELWTEALSVFGCDDSQKLEDSLKCLISIGTGIPSLRPFGPSVRDVAASLKAIATESESKAQQFQRQYPFLTNNHVFFRFNVTHGLEDVGLEEASRLGDIESSTDRYCASPSVMQNIETCVDALKRRPWILDAISKFQSRFGHPFLRDLYQRQAVSLSKTELERFLHTRFFQEWICGDKNLIVCTTSREVDGVPCALAAGIADHLEHAAGYSVVYVDCFWVLQTPQQVKTHANRLKAELKDDRTLDEGSVDLILESIYSQLFRRCPRREGVLRAHNDRLPEPDASSFRSQLLESGMPQESNILALIENLLLSTDVQVLISVDRIHELQESALKKLMSILALLRRTRAHPKVLLCADDNMIADDGLPGEPLVSDETEFQECLASLSFQEIDVRKSQVPPAADGTTSWIWSHPVYKAFAVEESGMLWIRGKPGSGKSVLARSIQHRLLEASSMKTLQTAPTVLVGDWFYHRRRGGGYVRHESFVRSVLYHFLQQNPGLFEDFFQEIYRTMDPRGAAPWTYDILGNIFTAICQSKTRVFCIVDAVDEAESAEILSFIRSLVGQESHSRARFIILSRPNVQIERHIEAGPSIVMEDENENDIKRIVELGLTTLQKAIHSLDFANATPPSRLKRIPRRSNVRQSRFRSLDTTAGREMRAISEIGDVLVSKAQGSILWVKLLLDKLTQEADSNKGSTLEELRHIVNSVPEELSDYYRQIEEELTRQKPAERIREIRQALMWICGAAEVGDVTLEELWEALAVLKDNCQSTTLDGIWDKLILVNSYDELWRKISSICGPFIEIFNPGLSAEESRVYHCGQTSICQLMHQSVRDFLCEHGAARDLHFTLGEARELVRNNLERYLKISMDDFRRMRSQGLQDPQTVVNWLSDQRLLRLAIEVSASRLPITPSLRATREWSLIEAPRGTPESLLVSALHDYWRCTGGVGALSDNIVVTGRILYHSCAEGLSTAVRNIQALGWMTPEEAASAHGDIAMCCIFFVASRCKSARVKVELDLGGQWNPLSAYPPHAEHDPLPKVNNGIRSTVPKLSSPLRYLVHGTDLPDCSSSDREPPPVKTSSPFLQDAFEWKTPASEESLDVPNVVGRKGKRFSHDFLDHWYSGESSTVAGDNHHFESNLEISDPGDTTREKPLDDRRPSTPSLTGSKNELRGPVQDDQSYVTFTSSSAGWKSREMRRPITPELREDGATKDSPDIESFRADLEKRTDLSDWKAKWVTCPWTVILKISREVAEVELRMTLEQWVPFLDLVCGSKRPKAGRREESNEELEQDDDESMVAPVEDVEDAIAAAVNLYR